MCFERQACFSLLLQAALGSMLDARFAIHLRAFKLRLVVLVGCVFVFHLAHLIRQAHRLKPHHHVYLSAGARKGLQFNHVGACIGKWANLPAKLVSWSRDFVNAQQCPR